MPKHPANPAIRLLDGAFYARDPFPHFRWLREHAPVFHDATSGVWAVSRHEDVLALSRDPKTFCSRESSRPDAPPIPSMINLDDPLHRRRRSLVNQGFTPRRLADQEPGIRAIVTALIDRVIERGCCDFVREIAAPLPMSVIGDMLGVAPEDRDMLLRWSDDLVSALSSTAEPALAQRALAAFSEYSAYHRQVVAERRVRPTDDLVSVILQAEIDGQRLSDEDVLQETLLVLVGGDETTRHVITGGMEQLLRHPDQHRALASDPARLPTAIEEMLRWVTPIQNMNRSATRDVVLRGEALHAGDKILLLYPSANRDERVFRAPERFETTRTPNDHLAFGFGAHFCLGANLARLELRVVFEELLRRLPELTLASDAPLPRRASNFIVGIETMPVAWPVA